MTEPKQVKQNRKEAEKRLSEKVEEIKLKYECDCNYRQACEMCAESKDIDWDLITS